MVIRLITISTDVYTFFHIKQSSTTYHKENHICKICHTHCNNQNIYEQKIDIPFKSTSFANIVFALLYISFSLDFVQPYWYFLIVLFFSLTVNIPLIVCLSRKTNFENMAAARQRTNSLAWNRTQNQQWEVKCAHEQRNQTQQMAAPESFRNLHTSPVHFL